MTNTEPKEPSQIERILKSMEPKQGEIFVLTTLRKNLGQRPALEKLGFKVNVQVCRLTKEDGESIRALQGQVPVRELNEKASELAKPAYQLRVNHEEYAKLYASKFSIAEQREAFERAMRSNYMAPKGGHVKVEVVNPLNGKTYVGEHHFKHNTIFCSKKAGLVAYGKMFSKVLADSSMGRVRGKRVINELVG